MPSPLTGLLKRESSDNFGLLPPEAFDAFHDLKRRLCESPVLALPEERG